MCSLWNAMGSLSVDLQILMASGIEKKADLECRVEYYALPMNKIRVWDCVEKQSHCSEGNTDSQISMCSINDEWWRSSTTQRCLKKYVRATYTKITGGIGNNILCILGKQKKRFKCHQHYWAVFLWMWLGYDLPRIGNWATS